MDHQDLSAQLKQLLKRGYSLDDIRNLVIAPRPVLERAIREFEHQSRAERHQSRMLQRQADYAMRLRLR